MSACDFNPNGNPRRWQGIPGVKYPEEVAAERMREREEAERGGRRPSHCPAGYVQTREVCLLLHLSETRTRAILRERGIEYVEVVPVHGCRYQAWPRREVMKIRAEREAAIKNKWLG